MSDTPSPVDAPELPVVEGTELSVPCRHLRSKAMYVYSDMPDEIDQHDNSIFWCLKSMRNFGPDDEHVNGEDCRRSGRSCYQPF